MARKQGGFSAHEWLAEAVGTWQVRGKYYVNPGEEPFEALGTETIEMLGPYWQRGTLTIEVFGSVVQGVTHLGFDPTRQVFLSTWIDSANPFLYRYEGTYDAEVRLLSMAGVNIDPNTGKPATYRSIASYDLPKERSMSLSLGLSDGEELEVLSYEYERG